jgi:phosphoesterase RecJ-like protein
MAIAGELIDAGADPYAIVEQVYYRTKPSTLKLLGRVLGEMECHHDGQLCVLSVTNKMLAECHARSTETEGIVDWSLLSEGVLVGAFVKEVDANKSKASLRSKDIINVAAIAAEFGGGGHINAAGCVIELPLEQAKQRLIEKFGKALQNVE